ncbi:hypothetical protein ACSBR1_008636 [Camellia fascicularis]
MPALRTLPIKIGQGAYGTVYRGNFSNDVHVAVKILNNVKGNEEEFTNEVGTIGWEKLQDIALGIAKGIDYLHRKVAINEFFTSTLNLITSFSHIAPKVFSQNFRKVSCKSDVYSFRMLLLEMVAVRNNKVTQNTGAVYFPEWIYNRLDHGEDLEI